MPGDPLIMQQSVLLAREHGVSIGAHPSYPDLQGFGRRHLACSAEEVEALVLYQLGALDAFCRAAGTQIDYVKPHGALYNDLLQRDDLLQAVLRACARYRAGLPLMLLARGCQHAGEGNVRERELAEAAGVPLLREAFADRAYQADGSLAPVVFPVRCTSRPSAFLNRRWPSPVASPLPHSMAVGCVLRPTASACMATTPNPWRCCAGCGRNWTACDPPRTGRCRSALAGAGRSAG